MKKKKAMKILHGLLDRRHRAYTYIFYCRQGDKRPASLSTATVLVFTLKLNDGSNVVKRPNGLEVSCKMQG